MEAQSAAGAGPGVGPGERRRSSGAANQSRRERWDWTAVRIEGPDGDARSRWAMGKRLAGSAGVGGLGSRSDRGPRGNDLFSCSLLVETRGGQGLPRRLSRNSPLGLWTEIH